MGLHWDGAVVSQVPLTQHWKELFPSCHRPPSFLQRWNLPLSRVPGAARGVQQGVEELGCGKERSSEES